MAAFTSHVLSPLLRIYLSIVCKAKRLCSAMHWSSVGRMAYVSDYIMRAGRIAGGRSENVVQLACPIGVITVDGECG